MKAEVKGWRSRKNHRPCGWDTATVIVSYGGNPTAGAIELEIVRARGERDEQLLIRLTPEAANNLIGTLQRGLEYVRFKGAR
jgi:hypothetical protein